jgi:hypothetical protein
MISSLAGWQQQHVVAAKPAVLTAMHNAQKDFDWRAGLSDVC